MGIVRRIAFSCLLIVVLAGSSFGQNASPDPFAGVETRVLPNGLKVWFKRTPGQPVVALSVAVPAGFDDDPRGREQLAHYLEHLQFADHLGLSSRDIKKQIEDRGGVWNGNTNVDHTFYFAHVAPAHGLFALEWLYRVVSPHSMDPEVMDRERQPVEVEVGARPRQLFEWVRSTVVNPAWLRPPGFWKREFGLSVVEERDYYPYASLRAITRDDLTRFYRRHYRPDRMTLTIAGDLDRDAVMALVDRTFAGLTASGPPPDPAPIVESGRGHATFLWAFGSDIRYSRRFRVSAPTATDELLANFIARLLGKRLNDRLRYGQRKAVYTIFASLVNRGPASYFEIEGSIRPTEYDFARSTIDAQIADLRNATMPPGEFESLRATVVEQLRNSTSRPEDLESWVAARFFNRARHDTFPDVIAVFEHASQADVAAFAQRVFLPEREVLWVQYVFPLSQAVAIGLGIGLIFAVVTLMRRLLVGAVDMRRLRYVAKFRTPPAMRAAGWIAWLAILVVVLRALAQVFMMVAGTAIAGVDSFVVQYAVFALMAASLAAVVVLALSRIPRKVLVFDDRILIKYLAYRSRSVPHDEVEEVSLRRFREVWMTGRIRGCVPLAAGVFAPGIYLRLKGGRAWFFDVRDRDELVEVLTRRSSTLRTTG